MDKRLNPYKTAPATMQQLIDFSQAIGKLDLEPALCELVKIRASQINGCGFCLHMHTLDARRHGESEIRLHLLAAWRETDMFDDREKAALAWTEALTRLPTDGAPEAVYTELGRHFTEAEIVDLTMLVATINAWNRFGVGFAQMPPKSWSLAA